MKHASFLSLVLGAGVLFTAGHVLGQNKAAPAAPAPAAKQQRVVKIATLGTPELNREFQANVQFMQAQRQAATELNVAWDKEKDPKKKAELKVKLDQLLAQLNENNEKMIKAYGFSLNRNYTIEIVSSNIYTFVTDEEFAALEKVQKAEAEKAKSTKK